MVQYFLTIPHIQFRCMLDICRQNKTEVLFLLLPSATSHDAAGVCVPSHGLVSGVCPHVCLLALLWGSSLQGATRHLRGKQVEVSVVCICWVFIAFSY